MHKQPMFTKPVRAQVGAVAGLVAAGMLLAGAGVSATGQQAVATTTTPAAAPAAAAPTFSDPGNIDNRYLPLTRATTCVMRGSTVDGIKKKSVKTVLDKRRTFDVDGQSVQTVAVRDDSFVGGKMIESTEEYFAQSDEGTVYYFGEDVKNLKNGKVVNTKGTWLYGKDTDTLGVAMPNEPKLDQQWRFEDVPNLATMETNQVVETGLRTKVRKWGVLDDVIRVEAFVQPDGEVEYTLYASGVGLVAEYPPDARSTFHGCS